MDIAQFVSQFIYRIRYWLLWGTLFVTGLVIYFTQFLPYSYTVESSIYAGVTNSTTVDGTTVNYTVINSTFDNLINIAKSRGTLEKVSIRLLANAFTYGEEWKDNHYIQAKHYRQLLQMAPKEVLQLVDRKNVEKTIENLTSYRKEQANNFVYSMFNRPVAFYSANALNKIEVKRAGSSDILNITYTSADPGITQQTVSILIDELIKAYEILRFKATNDVIAYFEEQVRLTKQALNREEDDLMNYNVQERVINYPEETKALAITRYEVEDRLEDVEKAYESATARRKMLEEKMDIRAQIIRSNTNLLQELEKVSTLNQSIMEREIFTSDKSQENSPKLYEDKIRLKKAEENISHLSDNLNEYNFSKEGVGIDDMVTAWLTSCIDEAKAKAQLQVLLNRQKNIFDQYSHMSPIGTQVNRKQRAINIAEDNYRTQLKGLADANLRLKNIEMGTSNLQTVSPPDYPLTDNGRKRIMYVLIAFIGSIVFIVTYFLLIELLDRTLRDPLRSKRLSGLPVIAAFNGTSNLKFRGFLKTCNRLAAAYSCRQLNNYLQKERPTIVNLLSMEAGEGKSYLAKYFVDYWETEGIKTRVVIHGVDFDVEAKEYVNAQQLSSFWKRNEAEQEPDIILVEYPAINNASIPLETLRQADVNLLVANACRLWRNSDNAALRPIKEAMDNVPFFLYLNNADREVVESFTGELPPRTPLHSFVSRLAQLGLTSKKAAVK
ncbi:GumC family protein [Bacteroides oleiciplenus]|uniref:Exopolysaccharide biosynthesis protein n=1 Tax=Bacteroides oleiciplenus TaxID=626931 RepID=A0A3E5BIN5_9BACE|nr:hypothetical protein [Bacteroides oleiciplenus]RGN37444.1 hypothetical protein DXB65_08080 [Bacteroides oleiciplenus]